MSNLLDVCDEFVFPMIEELFLRTTEINSRLYLGGKKALSERDRRGLQWYAKFSVFSREFYRAKSQCEAGLRYGKQGNLQDGYEWSRAIANQ